MDDKLKSEISAEVDKIFAGKKEEDMRKRTENALNESASAIETLTSDLESERVKVTELEGELAASEEAKKTLEGEKSEAANEAEKASKELTKEVKELKENLEEKSQELEGIKKDAIATSRMEVLTSAGVARNEKDEQEAKVKEMSDEDFEAYKDELVSVRESILAELESEKEEKSGKKVEKKVEKKEAKVEEKDEGSKEAGVNTPPANIDPGASVSAAMNMEIYPSEDIMTQYREMGKAMAEAMTKDK